MEGYIYIIESLIKSYYYIGVSKDPERRLEEHNKGLVKATKYSSPWKLVLVQRYNSYTDALKVEVKLKKLRRKDYLYKMIKDGFIRIRPLVRAPRRNVGEVIGFPKGSPWDNSYVAH